MKHAGENALDQLEPLLAKVRQIGAATLKEKQRGVFYRDASAFLHFHEDDEGLFADLKIDGEWSRNRVSTTTERQSLLKKVRAALA